MKQGNKETGKQRRGAVTCFPLFVFVATLAAAFMLAPIRTLLVRDAARGAMLFCSEISAGDDVFFLSINSIFSAPVQDRLRVLDDGAFGTVDVVSTPAVMNYYAIDAYVPASSPYFAEPTLVRGIPLAARYRQVRVRVGPRGQQRMVARGIEIALYKLVEEGTALVVSVENSPRVLACR